MPNSTPTVLFLDVLHPDVDPATMRDWTARWSSTSCSSFPVNFVTIEIESHPHTPLKPDEVVRAYEKLQEAGKQYAPVVAVGRFLAMSLENTVLQLHHLILVVWKIEVSLAWSLQWLRPISDKFLDCLPDLRFMTGSGAGYDSELVPLSTSTRNTE